ncbi:hypothetical protein AB4Y34_41465, partial [Paraburkholderia sp. BR10954]
GSNPIGTVSVGSVGNERTITNVAAGRLSGTSTDAVNGSQLYATNQQVDQLSQDIKNGAGGGTDALAVHYDDAAKGTITLGGDSNGTTIKNVAAGDLSSTSKDAVNGSQLYATNQNVTNLGDRVTNVEGDVTTINGDITTINGKLADAVLYDTSAHDSVTLGGAGASSPVALHNVAAGAADTDAVNVSQLKDAGIVDGSGNIQNVVTYDDASKGTITLGGAGGTKITNVAAGTAPTDAVNVSQLSTTVDTATRYFKANGKNDGTDDASATGTRSVAIGANANAMSGNSIALGSNASTSSMGSIALGANAVASAANSVALGAGSIAMDFNVVSVGSSGAERRITNVGDAQLATDAVNLRTLDSRIGSGTAATLEQVSEQIAKVDQRVEQMSLMSVTPQDVVGNGGYFVADGLNDGSDAATVVAEQSGLAAGAGASSRGYGAVAVGTESVANGTQATAIGSAAQATISNATAIGGGARANGSSSVAIGSGAAVDAGANFSTAIGSLSHTTGVSAVAIGNSATAAAQSLAIGTNSVASVSNSAAIGYGARSTSSNSVALGAGSIADAVNSVSIGSQGNERYLTNVAAGVNDTDGVNVSQLKQYVADNAGSDPLLAVKYDDASKGTVTLGGDSNGTKVTNVAEGELSSTSKDAVNGSQLHATNQQVEQNTTSITNLGDQVTNIDGRVTNLGDR